MSGIFIVIGALVFIGILLFGANTVVDKYLEMRNDARAYRENRKGNDE